MGKVKGIFATNISGRVGNVVFRKNGSENIVSQRPASVKNPRSYEQMIQRAYIKTASSAYSILKPMADHSFEGISYGAKSMQYFSKTCLAMIKAEGRAVIKDSRNVLVSEMPISKGSLQLTPYTLMENKDTFEILFNFGKLKWTMTEGINSERIMANLGGQVGDQITVIRCDVTNQYEFNGIVQYEYNMLYSRYIFNKDSMPFEGGNQINGNKFINPANINPNSEINNSVNLVLCADNDANFQFAIMDSKGENKKTSFYAIILSRKSGSTWQRSTSKLLTLSDLSKNKIEDVIDSYMPNPEMYLNNATL